LRGELGGQGRDADLGGLSRRMLLRGGGDGILHLGLGFRV